MQQVFARQALPMVWDFCEANPFSASSGNFVGQVGYLANVVEIATSTEAQAAVIQQDAAENTSLIQNAIVATDPPYYDNIGYAYLSDFFYVWQRRALREIWPDLFRRVLAPKDEELVATPYRHGGKEAAERFFSDGIGYALRNMHRSAAEDFPVTLYYAFKQSEVGKEGLTSPGWATFLQGLVNTEYMIDGTWPMRFRPGTLCRITEFSEHESNGRELDEGERVAVEVLPVLGQSAAAVEPGDGAFDHPTPGLDDEALHPIGSLDDLGLEIGQDAGQGAVKDRALIGAVGEQFPEKGKQTEQGRQQRETAVAILNVGGGDDAVQQQALRIDQNMPLLALDQLAGIEAVAVDASPPFSALFTL